MVPSASVMMSRFWSACGLRIAAPKSLWTSPILIIEGASPSSCEIGADEDEVANELAAPDGLVGLAEALF